MISLTHTLAQVHISFCSQGFFIEMIVFISSLHDNLGMCYNWIIIYWHMLYFDGYLFYELLFFVVRKYFFCTI